MLKSAGFNLWAENYDESVGLADENNDYPFAGYKELMDAIYGTIMMKKPAAVLDIGIGTGTLAAKLYQEGNSITGIDFSEEMLKIAAEKMSNALLIQHDFSAGLPQRLDGAKFDFIISTYALHHLPDEQKADFILSLLCRLKEGGKIIIGDVGFRTRSDLEKCKDSCGDEWDDEEFYFVYSEMNKRLSGKCKTRYYQFSHCSGVAEILPI